jgi:DNA-binding transcriptional MerR regulator
MYHISELEQLSGIKAATIRMWERRYGLFKPCRTDTNIRMYDESQVRLLLDVSTLLSNGYRISRIAAMQESELSEKIRTIQARSGGDVTAVAYVHGLMAAILDLDERAFEKGLMAIMSRHGLWDTMLKIAYPLFQKLGIMWAAEKCTPVQEHFASAVGMKWVFYLPTTLYAQKTLKRSIWGRVFLTKIFLPCFQK